MAGISQKLAISQKQSLAMTPQLQQSLKLLQLSTIDLAAFVDQELEQNPLLEIKQDDGERREDHHEDEYKETSDDGTDTVTTLEKSDDQASEAIDADFSNNFESERNFEKEDAGYTDFGQSGGYDKAEWFDRTIGEEISLREHLQQQIELEFKDPEKTLMAFHLLDQMDENGYINFDSDAIAKQLGAKTELIDKVFGRLQNLEPTGVFSRDLAECLKLQLKEHNRFDPAMEKLLENLDLVAKVEIAKLSKICGVSEEDILDMCNEIRSLDPKPGSSFSQEPVEVVHIDIMLTRTADDDWAVELNSERLPKLLVNKKYYTKVKGHSQNDQEKEFIAEQYQTANWLVRSLEQRANTILKVSRAIVQRQQEFFDKGIYYLKPLILQDIADDIEMHESTVARVTVNKYMSTPRGVFELKYFFSSSIASDKGEDFSSTAVKHAITQLIENEDPKAVLSDDKISQILQNRGMDVARRTVAKYREAEGIPTSSLRRRQKKLSA